MLNKAQKWVFQALLLIRSWLPFALFFTEQKNNDVVRRHVGYLRLQTEQEVELLNELYDRLRLLVNFFYPSQKLVSKTRQGARVRRPSGELDDLVRYSVTTTVMRFSDSAVTLRRGVPVLRPSVVYMFECGGCVR